MLVDKYRPKLLSDIIGNEAVLAAVRKWADEWASGRRQTPLLIYGGPGCGKTSVAHALANEMGWELLETNASDLRNKGSLEAVVGRAATESTLMGNLRLIVVDEVDGINTADRGAVGAIISAIESSGQPIILIANNAHKQKLKPLKDAAKFLQMKAVNPKTLVAHLKHIVIAEKIPVTDERIGEIANRSCGDVRSSMIDLMSSEYSSHRDRDADLESSLKSMFKAEDFDTARRSMWDVDLDPEMKMLWIDENIPIEFERPEDIHRAFEHMSRADVMVGRISRRQQWGLMKYIGDLSTAGVASAKDQRYMNDKDYRFPSYLLKMSRTVVTRAIMKNLCKKLGSKMHLSIHEVHHQLPLIAPFALKNTEYFGLEETEVSFLKGFFQPSDSPPSLRTRR